MVMYCTRIIPFITFDGNDTGRKFSTFSVGFARLKQSNFVLRVKSVIREIHSLQSVECLGLLLQDRQTDKQHNHFLFGGKAFFLDGTVAL